MSDHAHFIEEFSCDCGCTGHAMWLGEAGSMRKLITLSQNFKQAPGGDPSNDSRISCVRCGIEQPEQRNPALTLH
jgi:hypothetical protein